MEMKKAVDKIHEMKRRAKSNQIGVRIISYNKDNSIRDIGEFLFDNEYSLPMFIKSGNGLASFVRNWIYRGLKFKLGFEYVHKE